MCFDTVASKGFAVGSTTSETPRSRAGGEMLGRVSRDFEGCPVRNVEMSVLDFRKTKE
jgi:hypothetical protein